MRNKENYLAWLNKNKNKIREQKNKWATSPNGRASAKKWRDKSPKALRKLYIASAKKRNIFFDIDEELFIKLINNNCNYCGQSAIPKRNGIDRINNSKGYTKNNIATCCFKCNQIKGKLTVDELFTHIIKIFEHAIK